MRKIGFFLNYDPHYREPIYTEIDSRWNCVWFFADLKNGVKHIGLEKFAIAKRVKYRKLVRGLVYQSGWFSLLKDKSIDTIILTGELNNVSTWMILLLRPLISPTKRIFTWTHGWYGRESKIKTLIKRIAAKLVTGDFLYSNRAKSIAISNGCREEKLHVIHNSLNYSVQLLQRGRDLSSDIYFEHFANHFPVIVFIGRLAESKRLDMLICAMHKLKQFDINLNAVFIGGGDVKFLESVGTNYNLTNRLWFYGPCYDEDINSKLIYNADVCVSPGNVGLTAIHSLMFGTPVITHDDFPYQGPEVEAIKTGTTGAFFKKGDVSDLANVIKNWLANKTNREETRQYCYHEVDSYWTPSFQMRVLESVLD